MPQRRGFFPCPPQAAPCYEWFEPFFVPGEHYVPVDGNFNNLTMAIAWAQAHDAEVQKMVAAANRRVKEVDGRTGSISTISVVCLFCSFSSNF